MGSTNERGPAAYLNWQAAREQKPLLHTEEHPLYTDACITGEVDFEPYHFLNATPTLRGVVLPAVVLRFDWYWKFPHPDFSQTDAERYHGGAPPDEIAALASLAMGVRFRAGDSTREFLPGGDPKGHPRAWTTRPIPLLTLRSSLRRWVLPRVAEGEHSLQLLQPLSIVPGLNLSGALSLIRAARVYQDALWLAESEPALSWLLLVTALETAAQHWRSEEEDPLVRFQTAKPDLYEYLSKLEDRTVVSRVAEAFKDSFGATRKFLDFVLRFRPIAPQERPGWGAIDWSDTSLEKILRVVYGYRSKALHAGKPFPAPMCQPPYREPTWPTYTERPWGDISTSGAVWLEEDLPLLLHTFEYITRETLLNWWHSLATPAQKGGP
jgi:hypothetical protein